MKIGANGIGRINQAKLQDYLKGYSKQLRAKFLIKEIEITPTLYPHEDDKEHRKLFESCFGKGESKHHGYLKWFAYNYIKENAINLISQKIVMEVNLFLPTNIPFWETRSGFGITEYGRILEKEEDVMMYCGSKKVAYLQEADLALRIAPIIVECGVTSTMSLTWPLTTSAVSKIIWLPYQNNENRRAEWVDFKTPLKAFEITLANK